MFKNFENYYFHDKISNLKMNCKIISTKFIKRNEIYKYSTNISKEKIYLEKIIALLFNSIYIYLFYSIILIECKQKKINFDDSIIQLKVKGSERMQILNNEYSVIIFFVSTFPINKYFIREKLFSFIASVVSSIYILFLFL